MVTQVDMAFNKLLRAFRKKKNVWKKTRDGRNVAMVGSWTLDSGFGGFRVAQISNKGGGKSDPFGSRRRGRAEFIRWVNDVITAKNVGKRK